MWLVTPMTRAGSCDGEAHALEERLAVEHGVRVDTADVPVARDVQRCVQRVRLAAVVLVHDDEVRMLGACDTSRAPRCVGKHVPHERLVRLERERLDERGERPVGGAVVDDDDLVLGVVELEQRPCRRRDDAAPRCTRRR